MSRRCVIYCRRSKKESKNHQDNREPSVDQQLRACRATATEQGFELVAELQEEGSASGKGRTRPEFAKVIELATSGAVDVVLVWEEERLSRNNIDNQDLLDAEKASPGLEIWSAEGRIPWKHFESEGGRETRKLAKRTERGWRTSLRQGKPGPGSRLKFGYKRDRDHDSPTKGFAVVDEENARHVREIFKLYVEGIPAREIKVTMEARGCKRNFDRMALNRIIKDKAYMTGVGTLVRKAKYGFPEETFDVQFPPLIDQEIWIAAQAQIAKNRGQNNALIRLEHPSLLAGMVWCEECNWKMHVLNRPGKYRCGHSSKKLQARNPNCVKTVSIDEMDTAVWQQVRNFVNTPSLLNQLIDNRATELKAGIREDAEADIQSFYDGLEELEAKAEKYLNVFERGNLPVALLEKRVLEIEFAKSVVENDLAEAEGELITRLDPDQTKEQARKLLGSWNAADLENHLDDLDAARRLVRKCVEKVTFQPGTAKTKVPTIYFKVEVPAVQMPSATELERSTPIAYHVPARG